MGTMITQPGDGTDASGYARTRVSDAGRERAIDLLKAAFAEARLTRGKHTPNASSAPTARGHTPHSPRGPAAAPPGRGGAPPSPGQRCPPPARPRAARPADP